MSAKLDSMQKCGFHHPKEVANRFIQNALKGGIRLTLMQLMKLLYFAHGWHLAIKGAPLLNERVEAWQYGPVVHSLYSSAKKYGAKPINELLEADYDDIPAGLEYGSVPLLDPNDDSSAAAIVDRVWDLYGHLSGPQLMELTHRPGTPWDTIHKQCGGRIPRRADIPDDLIKEHFKDKLARGNQPA